MPKESAAQSPDWLLLSRQTLRLPDRGPRYKETPADPTVFPAGGGWAAEPWNTATAFLFVVIVIVWAVRLRGRYRQFPFLTGCLPILLAGGIGGTLYHATRVSFTLFLLDVIPISLLGVGGSVYLTVKLGRTLSRGRLATIIGGLLLIYLGLNSAIRLVPNPPPNLPVNLSYASLAVVLLVPVVGVLMRTGFRHAGWVIAALVCFAFAWFFRLVDNTPVVDLPMGTHWLWHAYGAATTWCMTEYFYRLEGEAPHPPTEPTPT